jgi:hypothetical protein
MKWYDYALIGVEVLITVASVATAISTGGTRSSITRMPRKPKASYFRTKKVPGGKVDLDCYNEMMGYGDGSIEDWEAAVHT